MAQILIIDDEVSILRLLEELFHDQGHRVTLASSGQEGLAAAMDGAFDLVFIDVRLPDGDGLVLLPRLLKAPSHPEVVIMTGYGEPEVAELAITKGAWDYLEKPPSLSQITLVADRALQHRHSQAGHGDGKLARQGLVGDSEPLLASLRTLAQAARTDAPVLITGATGTGKELFARLLHINSSRAADPFVVADCASIPPNLVESYLFGHVRGAFTGAERGASGLVKQAHGGTLFLDEIGDLPMEMQRRLLRVLQEKTFRPVGSEKEESSDFRLVAATNQDLESMVAQGSFREDLFYRLRGFHLKLPTLAQRKDDIEALARHQLHRLCSRYGLPDKDISPDCLAMLEAHDWPGNVRELLNVMDASFHRAGDSHLLFSQHLPLDFRALSARRAAQPSPLEAAPAPEQAPGESGDKISREGPLSSFREHRQHVVDNAEKSYLVTLIEQAGGNLPRAMRVSGLGKTRLYNLLKKHNLSLKGRNT